MTENERKAIDVLQDMITEGQSNGDVIVARDDEEELKTAIQALEEIQQYRAIGTVEEIQKKTEELERWHTDRINENIKNPFAYTSTSICHNCDRKDEYIEELEAENAEYKSIGTIEEFKALKEKNEDCIIKHLTNECSYNETGCSDCKGKETIRVAVEIVKKMYEHCEGSCVDCPYHNPNMDKCMNDLLKLK